MSTNVFSPAVIEKAKDILLGEGVLYYNYGEVGEAVIGATRGGSKLEIDWTKKEVEVDGAIGAVKGMRRTESCHVRLIVNFLKFSYVSFPYGLNVTVSDGSDSDGTYKAITFRTGFLSTDVMTNITFKGYKLNGDYCIIKVENALDINDISLEFKEKGEVVSTRTYTGFYTYALPTTPPLVVQEEI